MKKLFINKETDELTPLTMKIAYGVLTVIALFCIAILIQVINNPEKISL